MTRGSDFVVDPEAHTGELWIMVEEEEPRSLGPLISGSLFSSNHNFSQNTTISIPLLQKERKM